MSDRRCGTCKGPLAKNNTGSSCSMCERARALTDFFGDDAFLALRIGKAVATIYARVTSTRRPTSS